MKIRLATILDAAAMAPLAGQLGYPASASDIAERLSNLVGKEGNVVIVAEDGDGFIAGWTHVFVSHRLTSGPVAELGGLVVNEECRSAGVGTAIMEAAEEWARAQGCGTLRVRSNIVRKRAHDFYKKLGYSRKKQQSVLEKMLPLPTDDVG